MAELLVNIMANVGGEDIPWEALPQDLRQKISTRLHNDAMSAAGYKKAFKEQKTSKADM